MSAQPRLWLGVALVVAATLIYATIGPAVRFVAADAWTVVFWRGASCALAIATYCTLRDGRRLTRTVRAIGWPGLAVTFASASGTILYVLAVRMGTVADVSVIYTAVTFLAGVIAWVWLREKLSITTLAGGAIATAGVALSMQGAASHGGGAGDAVALLMVTAYATMIVVLRRFPDVPMLPTVGLAGLGAALVAFPLAEPFAADPGEIGALVACGAAQSAVGDALFTRGSQLIPSSRTALIATLDAPFATLFAWLLLAEAPHWCTIAGGTLVIVAVAGQVALDSWKRRTADVPMAV